jgi:hypothetical protein
MKDTIKNSIIGAFAIFGFVALISSSNTAQTISQETSAESQLGKYQIVITVPPAGGWIYETIFDTRTAKIISRERREKFSKAYPAVK